MKTVRTITTQLFFILFLLLLFSNFVQAETTNCTAITSLPYTITAQGIYCLTSDLSTSMTSGNAIEVATNNVVLDLNGHKVGNLSAGPAQTAYGIYAHQRKNITIRNGTVRGFYVGVFMHDDSPYDVSQGHLIEDIRADMNFTTGIAVRGQGIIIHNNQVVDTGGSAYTFDAYGIGSRGSGIRIINNDIILTVGNAGLLGESFGIIVQESEDNMVENNRIGNAAVTAYSYGIRVNSSHDVLLLNNRITKMQYGTYFDGGTGATGKYGNNVTTGCTTPFTGGINIGGNN